MQSYKWNFFKGFFLILIYVDLHNMMLMINFLNEGIFYFLFFKKDLPSEGYAGTSKWPN